MRSLNSTEILAVNGGLTGLEVTLTSCLFGSAIGGISSALLGFTPHDQSTPVIAGTGFGGVLGLGLGGMAAVLGARSIASVVAASSVGGLIGMTILPLAFCYAIKQAFH